MISLVVLTPNIPESGTKSRVETQVRVAVDLAHASTITGDQNQYDRVGSWKWLKLPPGTSTKRRARREGRIGNCSPSPILTYSAYTQQDPAPVDILHLTATVTCASAPHNHVVSCGSCRNREVWLLGPAYASFTYPLSRQNASPASSQLVYGQLVRIRTLLKTAAIARETSRKTRQVLFSLIVPTYSIFLPALPCFLSESLVTAGITERRLGSIFISQ